MVGKAKACPPPFRDEKENGGHAPLCPPYARRAVAQTYFTFPASFLIAALIDAAASS